VTDTRGFPKWSWGKGSINQGIWPTFDADAEVCTSADACATFTEGMRMGFFSKLGLSTKMLIVVVAVLVTVVSVNYAMFIRGYSGEVDVMLKQKADAFTAVADSTKAHQSALIRSGAIDLAPLVVEAQAFKKQGRDYKETRLFDTLPIIAAWKSAAKASEKEGLDFKVLAFEARNAKNEPAAGTFNHQLLEDLTKQAKAGGGDIIERVDEATNSLVVMRAVRLDDSCMMCHGDPQTSASKDGLDPLGFKMENWKSGDMHGAYVLTMPLNKKDEQVAAFLKNGLMFTIPLVVVGLGVLAWCMRTLLTKPIHNLIAMVRDVAEGEGDLTKRLNLNRVDELGQLAKWFDTFIAKLQDVIKQVASTTDQVAAASTQIAASSEQMAVSLGNQQQQTQQVSAAVEEMSSSVVEVAKRSGDAAAAASESGRQAQAGGQVVQQTVSEMKQIASSVQASSKSVSDLGSKSEQIGQIISVINDIADQTNLLALNAAIEAARAGEHGRGFAVVADEVRKLAERTTTATEEVARSIREIQTDTGAAVGCIEEGTKKVQSGVQFATNAGEALRKIVQGSENVRQMVQSIAAAAEEQSAAGEQISKSVEQINAVTRESAEGAQQSSKAAAELSKQAELLERLVGRFKV
jgi:methyl-accepting chemotaxis protein